MNFFLGIITGVVISVIAVYRFRSYVKTTFAPQEYEVASFSKDANPDGTFDVNFFVGDAVKEGYTKKQIPAGLKPEDLKVIIRSYHMGRGKYRVFWEVKPQKNDLS